MSAHCAVCGSDLVFGTGEDWQLMTCQLCECRDLLAATEEQRDEAVSGWDRACAELLDTHNRAEAAEQQRDEARAAVGGPLYGEWSQRWVDDVCHYRNLSIALGAKPDDMLCEYDRKLAETGIGDDTDYTQRNEARETWEDLEAAESRAEAAERRAAEMEAALQHYADEDHWDDVTPGPETNTAGYLFFEYAGGNSLPWAVARAALSAGGPERTTT